MLQTPRGTRGAVVAPHNLAAQAGLAVLREGGNAIEAMVAAASTVAVVYPHMNSIGGDNSGLSPSRAESRWPSWRAVVPGKRRRRSSIADTRVFRRAGRWQRTRWRSTLGLGGRPGRRQTLGRALAAQQDLGGRDCVRS